MHYLVELIVSLTKRVSAPLLELKSFEIKSKLIFDCQKIPKTLSENNNVPIMWVPGYRGIVGNKTVDSIAKKQTNQNH